MALTLEQQKSILTEIVKGENGKVLKSDLTEAKVTELQGLVGEELDVRFDFTRTETTQDEDGEDVQNEVVEDMYCNKFVETDEAFMTDRDALSNYEAGEDLTALEAKTKITL